eukprot:CAMPEP_0185615660 /NCGR_PEP_ID=MMETSP0436-20130131/36806_1 /TAXON_ID=626734 ORGANISM="Favella taraikaensis, Strain Fe Narragansett Bay" /NCGR_SAMPLE_ID=MMETSP0436 /ASSEMBLY_ACC=CAM_ASM_000390 /LENGTH=39 /DNA_ID= /DNA_START= /DNA_END= /DNA_ORIENTATION=
METVTTGAVAEPSGVGLVGIAVSLGTFSSKIEGFKGASA